MNCDCQVIHSEKVAKIKKDFFGNQKFNSISDLFKMFADSTRAKILFALMQDELCVCDIAVLLGMTKSAVSHQLKQLRISNLVKFRKSGKIVYYSLADSHVKDILKIGIEHINE